MSNYHIKHLEEYFQVYRKSVRNPEGFWEEIAEEHFLWRKKWDNVLRWDFSKPEVKWFENAKLNITENCIDRHLATRGDKTAILFEPNDPKDSRIGSSLIGMCSYWRYTFGGICRLFCPGSSHAN